MTISFTVYREKLFRCQIIGQGLLHAAYLYRMFDLLTDHLLKVLFRRIGVFLNCQKRKLIQEKRRPETGSHFTYNWQSKSDTK